MRVGPVGLDRRRLVHHARVVEQHGAPGLVHHEADAARAVGLEHPRLAAANVVPGDEDHRDEVDPVAVGALGRRPADPVGGVDAELVRLDEPALDRGDPREQRAQRYEQAAPPGVFDDRGLDRLEHPLDAAVQRVVVQRLPVRAVR